MTSSSSGIQGFRKTGPMTQARHILLTLSLGVLLNLLTWGGAQALVQARADAFVPNTAPREILPVPQEETALAAGFTVTPDTVLYLGEDTPALRRAAQRLQVELQERYGWPLELKAGGAMPAGSIAIGTNESPFLQLYLRQYELAPVEEAEGYVLRVDPTGVLIAGQDEQGALNGVRTLRQLLEPTGEVRGVQIRDWPDLPWRVAMIYLDEHSDEVNLKLLPLLAQYKYNAVLVMSNYVQWRSAPELHVAGGATPDMARRVAQAAREHGLEPIPLLETLSHAEWLFVNDQNRDLLVNPNTRSPYGYDPRNPRVYEVLEPILEELIAIFRPRYVHIGHDEVRDIMRVGESTPTFAQLFLQDTLRLHGYLQARGVRTMIWQDMLLQEDVFELIDAFPRDLVVTSWHYRPARDYPALRRLQDEGFTVLGASWYDPANIAALSQAAVRHAAAGMIQTRWTGYFGNRDMFRSQYPQVYAYLTGASRFWNADAEPPDGIAERFRRAWQGEPQATVQSGKLVNLAPYSNRTLADPDGRGWLDRGSDYDLSRMLEQERFAGFAFDLGPVISLRGTHRRVASDPERVEIPLNEHAAAVAFLHTTGWSVPVGTEVGHYLIHYSDGSQETIPLRYGQDLAAWTELEVTSIDLTQAWHGETRNGLPVAVSLLLWRNQRPEVTIARIEFVSAGTIANPMLLGLTLLDW
jgi:hexosaminidase